MKKVICFALTLIGATSVAGLNGKIHECQRFGYGFIQSTQASVVRATSAAYLQHYNPLETNSPIFKYQELIVCDDQLGTYQPPNNIDKRPPLCRQFNNGFLHWETSSGLVIAYRNPSLAQVPIQDNSKPPKAYQHLMVCDENPLEPIHLKLYTEVTQEIITPNKLGQWMMWDEVTYHWVPVQGPEIPGKHVVWMIYDEQTRVWVAAPYPGDQNVKDQSKSVQMPLNMLMKILEAVSNAHRGLELAQPQPTIAQPVPPRLDLTLPNTRPSRTGQWMTWDETSNQWKVAANVHESNSKRTFWMIFDQLNARWVVAPRPDEPNVARLMQWDSRTSLWIPVQKDQLNLNGTQWMIFNDQSLQWVTASPPQTTPPPTPAPTIPTKRPSKPIHYEPVVIGQSKRPTLFGSK